MFFIVESKHKKFIEERMRWQHSNDCFSLLLKATHKNFSKIKLFSEMIAKLEEKEEVDNRSEEEIIEDVLNKFK